MSSLIFIRNKFLCYALLRKNSNLLAPLHTGFNNVILQAKAHSQSGDELSKTTASQSDVRQFYDGKEVFITGGSGFLGRLLIEKLLRSCKTLKHIYMLLREKKGKPPEVRFKEIFDVPAFEKLKSEQPNFLSKISILPGDLEVPHLGLSESHQNMLKEQVNCIFHVGASVRLRDKLRKAAYINVRSVRDLLRIAKEMKQLKSFVHVSTAYSQCRFKDLDEIFYEPIVPGDKFLQMVEFLDDKVLDDITPKLLQGYPNTYAFTKSIAEEVVKKEIGALPIAIVRPSIVVSTYKEPLPGWVDNSNGATFIIKFAMLGLLRNFRAIPSLVIDLIPADIVTNLIVVSAWEAARRNKSNGSAANSASELPIFNCVSTSQNPIKWNLCRKLILTNVKKFPSTRLAWQPNFRLHSNSYIFSLTVFLYQKVPGNIFDFILKCMSKKPKFVDMDERISKFHSIAEFFATREWDFKNTNTQNLWKKLNSADKELYNFDAASFKWNDVFGPYVQGVRMYLLNDPMNTLPRARRKALRLKIIYYLLPISICLLFYKLLIV